VYLPSVEKKSVTTPAQPASLQYRGAGERILLVEDDRAVREFGCAVLRSLGYQVDVAANGLEALRQFKAGPAIDLLVTDVIMPNLGGRQLVQEIRRIAPDLRVLYTSGYTFDALGETDERESERDFLAKPYDQTQLGQKVHACLRRQTAVS
jgi:two-component system, cell cycle sensor histidine kinase and response regulator CckA